MSFLRTLFWVLATIVVVVFSMHNWRAVTLELFGGIQADVKLPLLLAAAFLLGFLPLYLYHRIVLWRATRPVAVAAPLVDEPIAPSPLAHALGDVE